MSQWQLRKTDLASAEAHLTYQDTNLHLFAEQGNLAEVNRCLASGEPVDKRNTRRQTALHCACSGGHHDVVRALLQRGADAAAKDSQMVSILHSAASGGSEEAVRLLLASDKAVVNARDQQSSTPLHSACKRGCIGAVRLLVAARADVNALDYRKRSPADVIGEVHYVRHDLAKEIKVVLNSVAGGFREQVAELRKANEVLTEELRTLRDVLHRTEANLDDALQETAELKEAVDMKDDELRKLQRVGQGQGPMPKSGCNCSIM